MFEKILIANRGEIALRILRACHEMGIRAVAVHSTADADAMHVRLADEAVCIGPPAAKESYLNMQAILSAASITNAEAIHPGYGFLSENARFAEMVEDHGFVFIGPSPEHLRTMGDKVVARRTAAAAGLPVVPGSDGPVTNAEQALSVAREIGYPVLVKASGGGGGRGMQLAETAEELPRALEMASREAASAFGNPEVYIEKFLRSPRHIEVQILADAYGNAVYLGERDCSLQRRHQKVLEEAPLAWAQRQPAPRDRQHRRRGDPSHRLPQRRNGRIPLRGREVLFHRDEHPVAGRASGHRDDLRVGPCPRNDPGCRRGAAQPHSGGHPVHRTRHRVPHQRREPGYLHALPGPDRRLPMPPGGMGVRVDSALYSGYTVPPYYDSMVAKLIVHGANRNECLMRLRRALGEFVIDGLETTIPLHQRLISEPAFIDGVYDNRWLEKFVLGKADQLSEPTVP